MKPARKIDFLNLEYLYATEPPPKDFVLPGLLAGTVGGLCSPGGTGKSMWILCAAMCVASPLANAALLQLPIEKHGPVVVLNAEDPSTEVHHRMKALYALLSPEAVAEVHQNLRLACLMGEVTDIQEPACMTAVREAIEGSRFVVFDTLRRWHTADENDNGEMASVLKRLEILAAGSGAAICFLHHTKKGSGQGDDSADDSRGASAIVDNGRWTMLLKKMTEAEALKLGVASDQRYRFIRACWPKANYSAPIPDAWFERKSGGVLLPVDPSDMGGLGEVSVTPTPGSGRRTKTQQAAIAAKKDPLMGSPEENLQELLHPTAIVRPSSKPHTMNDLWNN